MGLWLNLDLLSFLAPAPHMESGSNAAIMLQTPEDSGAGAGKTTASQYLSKKYNLDLLTSGLLYRMVAKKLLDTKKTIGKSLEQRFWISFTLDKKNGWFSGTKKKLPDVLNLKIMLDKKLESR